MGEAIGLIGGSFDPVHFGHLVIARFVAEALSLARMIFVPSAQPPHKPPESLAPGHHRLAMVRLAVTEEALFDVSDCELTRSGPSYTVDTIAQFRDLCGPRVQLCWVIGSDSLAELATWKDVPALVSSCRIVTVPRPGNEHPDLGPLERLLSKDQVAELRRGFLDAPRIDISATDIRQRVRKGLSIRYLVPETVREYILANRLYRA